jgi:hypothetical protein
MQMTIKLFRILRDDLGIKPNDDYILHVLGFVYPDFEFFVLFPLSIFDQIPVHKMLGVMEWWYPWDILKGDWQYKGY